MLRLLARSHPADMEKCFIFALLLSPTEQSEQSHGKMPQAGTSHDAPGRSESSQDFSWCPILGLVPLSVCQQHQAGRAHHIHGSSSLPAWACSCQDLWETCKVALVQLLAL